jgi:hypothetical protein
VRAPPKESGAFVVGEFGIAAPRRAGQITLSYALLQTRLPDACRKTMLSQEVKDWLTIFQTGFETVTKRLHIP